MHACYLIAFLVFAAAALVAGLYERSYVLALLAVGLAAFVAPLAFQLSS